MCVRRQPAPSAGERGVKKLRIKEKTPTQLRGGGTLVFVGYTLACETRFFDRNRRHRRKRKPRRAHRVPGSAWLVAHAACWLGVARETYSALATLTQKTGDRQSNTADELGWVPMIRHTPAQATSPSIVIQPRLSPSRGLGLVDQR